MMKRFRFSRLPMDVYWVIVQFQSVEDIYGKLALLERRLHQFSEQPVFFKYLWNLYFKNSELGKLYDRIDDDIGRIFKSVYRSGLFHEGKKHVYTISQMKGLMEWSKDLHLRSKKLHGIRYALRYDDSNMKLSLRSMNKKQYSCVVQFTGDVRNNLRWKFRGDEDVGLFGCIYAKDSSLSQRFCTRYHVSGSLDGRMVDYNNQWVNLTADFDYGKLKRVNLCRFLKKGWQLRIEGFYNVDCERHGKFYYKEFVEKERSSRFFQPRAYVVFSCKNGELVKTKVVTRNDDAKSLTLEEYKMKLFKRMDSTLKVFEEAVKYKKR